jgi:hypothetical protein
MSFVQMSFDQMSFVQISFVQMSFVQMSFVQMSFLADERLVGIVLLLVPLVQLVDELTEDQRVNVLAQLV